MYSAEELMRQCGITELKLKMEINLQNMCSDKRLTIGINQNIEHGVLTFEGTDALQVLYNMIDCGSGENVYSIQSKEDQEICNVFYTTQNGYDAARFNIDETCTNVFDDIETLDLNNYIDPDMPPEILSLGIVKDGKDICGLNSIFPNLKKVIVPNDIKIVGRNSFNSFMGDEVVLPDCVFDISHGSFRNSMISKINIPSSLEKIGNSAFEGCRNLPPLDISNLVEVHIGERAFEGCAGVKVTFDNQCIEKAPCNIDGSDTGSGAIIDKRHVVIEKYGDIFYTKYVDGVGTFKMNHDTTHRFPDVEVLDLNEFINKNNPPSDLAIEKLTIVDTMHMLRRSVSDVECGLNEIFPNLKKVIVPNGIKIIQWHSFASFEGDEVVLPESVEVIGSNVFSNSEISTINIPKKLKFIGDHAFMNCDNLKSMDIRNSEEIEILDKAFKNCTNIKLIILPGASSIGECAFEGWESDQTIIRPHKPLWFNGREDNEYWDDKCEAKIKSK